MNILVIDDSAFNRSVISGILKALPGVRSVETAVDGIDGYRQALKCRPDLIMLDLEMPNMDGLTFLRLMRKHRAAPVIVVSGVKRDIDEAVGLGASDFIEKPTMHASRELHSIRNEIARKVLSIPLANRPEETGTGGRRIARISAGMPEAIVIGASTGGPKAVTAVLKELPEGFSQPVVIAIHMPHWLTLPLSERLKSDSPVPVNIIQDRQEIRAGEVFLCPGGFLLGFVRDGKRVFARLEALAGLDGCASLIDRMMESAALSWGAGLAAVIMTGMGSDGMLGIAEVKRRGGYVLAECGKSAMVSSMPLAAVSTGVVDKVLSAVELGAWIRERCGVKTLKMA